MNSIVSSPELPMWKCVDTLIAQAPSGDSFQSFTKGGFYKQLDWSVGTVLFYNDRDVKHRLDGEVLYNCFKRVEPSDFN